MEMKDREKKNTARSVWTRFGQFIYLTFSNYTKNNLWESASACSFGFIFSFVPIALIIFTVLTGLLRAYPNILDFVLSLTNEVDTFVDIDSVIEKLLKPQSVGAINIFLAVWVVWMARKLFNSIIIAMNKVFRSVSPRQSWFNQVLTFIFEFALVIVVAVVMLVTFALNQLIQQPIIQKLLTPFPKLISQNTHNLVILVLYFVIFVLTVIAYRIVPGTKPLWRRCFFYAALSTVCFFLISTFMNFFMNVTNYNIVYGAISSLVLLMLKVYFFFMIFLFGAQMIYVSQFFQILLRSEIYLLPASEKKDLFNNLRRMLFINPQSIQTKRNTVIYSSGDLIYSENDKADSVFYLMQGTVCESNAKGLRIYEKGAFFGDVQCILNENRLAKATALTDVTLIVFSDQEFNEILHKSHHAATKAISKISNLSI